MKIVIVIDSWNQGNGCIVATHRLVNNLQSRGHEIRLYTTAGEEADQFNGEVFTVDGFYLPGVKKSMINMKFQFAKGNKKRLREAYQGADLVQIQLPYFVARNAEKVANKMGIPVIGACHIQSQNMTGAMGKDNKMLDWFFNSWFNFELFNRVPAIHCPSEFAANLIKSHGSNAHFRIISNGIPRNCVPMEEVKRPALFEDKFILLNIGRHAMEKRQELMIDAVLKSKYKDNIKLLICGKGETSETLREKGKQLSVAPLIEYISEEDKLLYLNTADMYLHSSVVELESLSCLEAIGCGMPCLISDSPNSATPQFACDDMLLFKMDDVDDMAAKIDYWYENRDKLPALRKKILEMAEQYRMDLCVDAMEQLYADVIAYANGDKSALPQGKKQINLEK